MKKANTHGGRRPGAGRKPEPPVTVADLPIADCPLKWLQSVMNCADANLAQRVDAAKTLLRHTSPDGKRAQSLARAAELEEVGSVFAVRLPEPELQTPKVQTFAPSTRQ